MYLDEVEDIQKRQLCEFEHDTVGGKHAAGAPSPAAPPRGWGLGPSSVRPKAQLHGGPNVVDEPAATIPGWTWER